MGCNGEAAVGGDSSTHGNLHALTGLEPQSQAELLSRLAQEARLVRLAADDCPQAPALSRHIEAALGDAMDADGDHQAAAACSQLTEALAAARAAGLKLSAQVSEMRIDGVLGAMKLPVLTAYLSVGTA